MHGSSGDVTVTDNTAARQFEATIGTDIAVCAYTLSGEAITFTHTEVPESLRGRGIGETLARAGLDSARARNLKVRPRCVFIASFIGEHSEYRDLLADPLI